MSWGPTYNEEKLYKGKLLVANEHDIIAVNDFAKKSAGHNQVFTQSKLIISHLAAPSGIFTSRGRSCGKVIFSRMSVCGRGRGVPCNHYSCIGPQHTGTPRSLVTKTGNLF